MNEERIESCYQSCFMCHQVINVPAVLGKDRVLKEFTVYEVRFRVVISMLHVKQHSNRSYNSVCRHQTYTDKNAPIYYKS